MLFCISLVIVSGMFFSVVTKKLTLYAALLGGLISFLIYFGVGYIGVVLLTTFFILGSVATSWKFREKELMSLEEEGKGKRSAGQVIANAGVGGISGLLAILYPEYQHVFLLMLAASFSSATSDTLSSELGNLYGKSFYNILSFKRDTKGLNGVISLEGTLFGIAGSVVIAAIYSSILCRVQDFFWIILAGTIGNLFDSVLGASLERKNVLNNNVVNFSNTAIAALVALLFVL